MEQEILDRAWTRYLYEHRALNQGRSHLTTRDRSRFEAGFLAASKLTTERFREFLTDLLDPQEDPQVPEPASPSETAAVGECVSWGWGEPRVVDFDTLLAIDIPDLLRMLNRALRVRQCDLSVIAAVRIASHHFRDKYRVVEVDLVDDERANRFLGPPGPGGMRPARAIEGLMFHCPVKKAGATDAP